jgi:enoyl-CoA hydratase/carnithine racemase
VTYADIELEQRPGYAVLSLNRPHRLNALSLQTVNELLDAFDVIAAEDQVHAVVLRANGRAFCAGIDLKEGALDMGAGDGGKPEIRWTVQQRYSQVTLRMRALPQPLIAAVQGYACGGGLSLAAACDIRLVAPDAQLNVAFVTAGLTGGDMGTSYFLPRAMGAAIAAELMLTGRFMDADEAVRTGFASRVVPAEGLTDAACEIATQIGSHNPIGIRMTKQMLNRSLDGAPLATMIEIENRSQVLCSFTGPFDEFVRRFQSDTGVTE